MGGSSVIHCRGSKSGRAARSLATPGSPWLRWSLAFCSQSAPPTPAWPARLDVTIPRLLLPQAVSEHDLDHICGSVLTSPVALKLAGQRHPADRLPAGPDHALKAGPVCLDRGSADHIDDRVHLEPLAQRVESGKGHADLGPESAEDQLPAAGRADGRNELGIFPRVHRRPVKRFVALEQPCEFGNRRLSLAGGDVNRRVHDGYVESLDRPDRRYGVLDQ